MLGYVRYDFKRALSYMEHTYLVICLVNARLCTLNFKQALTRHGTYIFVKCLSNAWLCMLYLKTSICRTCNIHLKLNPSDVEQYLC